MTVSQELFGDRVVVAGSRGVSDYAVVRGILDGVVAATQMRVAAVLSGCAQGVDRLGERWAEERGHFVERYPANWRTHGMSAGLRRNADMARRATAVVAVWDLRSRGTEHMIGVASRRGRRVLVVNPAMWSAAVADLERSGLRRGDAEVSAVMHCLAEQERVLRRRTA